MNDSIKITIHLGSGEWIQCSSSEAVVVSTIMNVEEAADGHNRLKVTASCHWYYCKLHITSLDREELTKSTKIVFKAGGHGSFKISFH